MFLFIVIVTQFIFQKFNSNSFFRTFPAYLATRTIDKPTSLFALFTLVQIVCFFYLHKSAAVEWVLFKFVGKQGVVYYIYISFCILLGTFFTLLHITATYQAIALANDNFHYAPGNTMVKLKDFNTALNLYCVGEKDHPTDPII